MSFDYEKIKKKQEDGNQWASYSDLFMVLSMVFLLLYVSTSLRTGTSNIQNHIEYQQLANENEDLKQQLRVYNSLKQNYVDLDANEREVKDYKELMSHLTLLQEEANTEKKELQKRAHENEKKEQALNQYQKMIRNIINTNMLAKAKIKKRDTIIKDKNEVIKDKNKVIVDKNNMIKENEVKIAQSEVKIKSLKNTIHNKKKLIVQNEEKLKEIKESLTEKVNNLNQQYQEQKMSKIKAQREIRRLQRNSEEEIAVLENQNNLVKKQLDNMKTTLEVTSDKVKLAQSEIKKINEDKKRLAEELKSNSAQAQDKMDQMEAEHKKALDKAQANEKARRKLAEQIEKNFKKAGIKIGVDKNTGDVILTFGKEYFSTGKHHLKTKMKKILKEFIPLYAKSLFKDKSIRKKISSVEIVGFASPTYKGKYINPKSLDPKDRAAVNYNLDLSYKRAKSIFKYMFHNDDLKYSYQKTLLSKVKVTGRSFFTEKGRDVASEKVDGRYCSSVDCKQSQRVIIKFNLKRK